MHESRLLVCKTASNAIYWVSFEYHAGASALFFATAPAGSTSAFSFRPIFSLDWVPATRQTLRIPLGDHARLAAARMGVALSQVFAALRRRGEAWIERNWTSCAKSGCGELFELTLEGVELPNGTRVGKAQI
ncbi:hypothetical protein [Xanthomonas citri]|uniref:hypothetical protein n=1 Tax=Xanthomonas citri TaxID=346 RepID=UPI001E311222|nr:hypothetical protein [Xanthomonas citri]